MFYNQLLVYSQDNLKKHLKIEKIVTRQTYRNKSPRIVKQKYAINFTTKFELIHSQSLSSVLKSINRMTLDGGFSLTIPKHVTVQVWKYLNTDHFISFWFYKIIKNKNLHKTFKSKYLPGDAIEMIMTIKPGQVRPERFNIYCIKNLKMPYIATLTISGKGPSFEVGSLDPQIIRSLLQRQSSMFNLVEIGSNPSSVYFREQGEVVFSAYLNDEYPPIPYP